MSRKQVKDSSWLYFKDFLYEKGGYYFNMATNEH